MAPTVVDGPDNNVLKKKKKTPERLTQQTGRMPPRTPKPDVKATLTPSQTSGEERMRKEEERRKKEEKEEESKKAEEERTKEENGKKQKKKREKKKRK